MWFYFDSGTCLISKIITFTESNCLVCIHVHNNNYELKVIHAGA